MLEPRRVMIQIRKLPKANPNKPILLNKISILYFEDTYRNILCQTKSTVNLLYDYYILLYQDKLLHIIFSYIIIVIMIIIIII
jgi:hypothetical protein